MRILILVILSATMLSCGVRKNVRYFEGVEDFSDEALDIGNITTFQKNDLIKIRVSSYDNIGVAPYNLLETSYVSGDGLGTQSVSVRPYLVKPDGTIDFPELGPILVESKTKNELRTELVEKLKPYIKEPRVDIEIINFKISVIGDVKSPGVFPIIDERVTVLEAMALAGDMAITGIRKNVLVIREENDKRKFIRVNFLQDSLFNSPAYYLKQNDVVYVEQNAVKTREASWDTKIPVLASLTAVIFSLISFFTR